MADARASDTSIAIAGAGIAGLTCALALAAHGHDVTVIEAFEAPAEIGAGLQVPPNASHVLNQLGVLDALSQKAIRPQALCLGDAVAGKIVLEMPVNASGDGQLPYLTAHRAIVHGVLYEAASDNEHINLLTGHRIVDAAQDDDGVTLSIAHGGERVEHTYPVVIGADGIWSILRNCVSGALKPEATGRIALRAVVPATAGDLPDGHGDKVIAWLAPSTHLVAYPVRNRETRNLVAVARGADDGSAQSWSQTVDAAMVDALYKKLANMPGAEEIRKAPWTFWPLFAVPASTAWHSGRVGLIGDAAHGIEPFSAQGAAMAIEDGYVLARHMAKTPDLPDVAFSAFHAERRDRLARVVQRTSLNRFSYHQAGFGRLIRNATFKARAPSAFLKDLDWLYGYRA